MFCYTRSVDARRHDRGHSLCVPWIANVQLCIKLDKLLIEAVYLESESLTNTVVTPGSISKLQDGLEW